MALEGVSAECIFFVSYPFLFVFSLSLSLCPLRYSPFFHFINIHLAWFLLFIFPLIFFRHETHLPYADLPKPLGHSHWIKCWNQWYCIQYYVWPLFIQLFSFFLNFFHFHQFYKVWSSFESKFFLFRCKSNWCHMVLGWTYLDYFAETWLEGTTHYFAFQ